VKEFFCSGMPPGGREKDNKKIIVNEKEKIVKKSAELNRTAGWVMQELNRKKSWFMNSSLFVPL
jgi:hypothetical protein